MKSENWPNQTNTVGRKGFWALAAGVITLKHLYKNIAPRGVVFHYQHWYLWHSWFEVAWWRLFIHKYAWSVFLLLIYLWKPASIFIQFSQCQNKCRQTGAGSLVQEKKQKKTVI